MPGGSIEQQIGISLRISYPLLDAREEAESTPPGSPYRSRGE